MGCRTRVCVCGWGGGLHSLTACVRSTARGLRPLCTSFPHCHRACGPGRLLPALVGDSARRSQRGGAARDLLRRPHGLGVAAGRVGR
jgi:hypothetical protein